MSDVFDLAEEFNPLRPGGDVLDDFSGRTGAEAALSGAQLQYEATLAGIDEQRQARLRQEELLAPFTEFGTASLPGLGQFMQDPSGASYLQNNPMFQAATDNNARQLMNIRAAQGRAGSGGTEQALFQNYLATGDQFAQQGFNRLLQGATLGQASAAGQAANVGSSAAQIADLLGSGGAAQAAGGIGAAQAYGQGSQNMMGLASLAASFFSDERLKEDVEVVGKDGELDVIEFKYKDHEGRYRGYRAHQVYEHDPDAVTINNSGYLQVSSKYAPERIS